MTIVSSELLEVFVGEEKTLFTLSLYKKDGIPYATFAAKDTEHNVWIPIPVPPIFKENQEMFEDFKTELSGHGYQFRDVIQSKVQ